MHGISDGPLSYGVRQAIRDSSRTTYEIGKLSGVSPQNLYRFLDEGHPRALSQSSLDKLGLTLKLSVTLDYEHFRPVHLQQYRRSEGLKWGSHFDKKINEIPDSPLSLLIRRTVELHKWDVTEFAQHLEVTKTQMYRFLDGSRGLSQEKLDSLCSLLGLLVEGPFAYDRARPGAMITGKRRIYRPRPAAPPLAENVEGGQLGTPSLHTPPGDPSDGES